MMRGGILKWTATFTNILLIVWMYGSAYAWGGGDWLGGTILSIPSALAIVALWSGHDHRRKHVSDPVKQEALCCFCSESVTIRDAAALVIYPHDGSKESQNLYVHRRCLRERVGAGVPLITEVID